MNNKPSKRLSLAVAALILALLVVQITRVNAQDDAAIAAAKKIAEAAGWAENVTLEYDDAGNLLVLSNGMPNHEVLDAYQALSVIDNKTTYVIQLQEQRMKVVIPLLPKLAETKTSTEIGLIGVAISGGLFYSPFEADGKTMALSEKDLVIDGIAFFDSCNGHPNPFAVQYHYHGIPFCITDLIDKPGEHSRMLGYLLDGFPVYGQQDAEGKIITPAELDECNGHFGPPPEHPEGIYHYHTTEEPPYTMPCYSGVIEVSDSVIDLFTRGVDLSYPPPPMPPGALLPKLPEVPKPPALPTAGK
jgi:YHYH protein